MKPGRSGVAHDPYEILLSVAFGLASLWQLIFGAVPGSTADTMPNSLRVAWVGLLCFGCVVTLFGALVPMIWGYLYEMVGLMASGGAMAAYGGHVMVIQIARGTLTPANILGGPLLVIMGAAFLWKCWQVYRGVREIV